MTALTLVIGYVVIGVGTTVVLAMAVDRAPDDFTLASFVWTALAWPLVCIVLLTMLLTYVAWLVMGLLSKMLILWANVLRRFGLWLQRERQS